MLSKQITQLFPYFGMLFFLLAIVFEIVSAMEYKTVDATDWATKGKQNVDKLLNIPKYHDLALIFSIIGVGLFVSPQ